MAKTVAMHTLGCKVNQYDGEAVMGLFREAGYREVPFEEGADVMIVMTCTVTAEADRKSRQMLHQAARIAPDAVVMAAGCFAQRSGEALLRDGLCDVVIGNARRKEAVILAEAARNGAGPVSVAGPLTADWESLSIHRPGEHTRANIKIQEGCDRYCTYCAIPYARGPIRSRPIGETRDEVAELAGQGIREFVLTGIHIASYGRDWPDGGDGHYLLELLRVLDEVPGLERIRIGSFEPKLLTEEFVTELAKIRHLCRHFHVSLQSGCDATLRRMARRYTADEYREGLKRLRKAMPGCACTTDIITGFPGETEEDFQTSLAFARECAFSKIHVFPYSPREGTRAAGYPNQVPRAIRRERAGKMIELSDAMQREWCASWVGKTVRVIPEEIKEGLWEGYTPEYIRVRIPGEHARGESLTVQLTEQIGQETLYGLPLEV